jgi:hypothetical protein
METIKNGIIITTEETIPPLLFAVLVPHRDCLPVLEAYRRNLFTAGLKGAFSFPSVAPLALLKRPLNSGELKKASAELGKNMEGRKFICTGYSECSTRTGSVDSSIEIPEIRFFGAVLELPLPVFPQDAVLQIWEKPVLAPAIITSGEPVPCPASDFNNQTLISRPAALANLALRPVPDMEYSFTWELGYPHWLPRQNRKRRSSALFT